MPDFVDLDQGVPLFHGFDQLGGAPGPAQRAISVGMRTIMVATQHGFGLLFLDTGAAERKGEFVPTAHGQDGVKQTSKGENVHRCDTKIRPQGLIDGLRDDLRMTGGVRAVLVHPRVQGGDVQIAYLLALPSHSMQGHRTCSAPEKGLTGFQGRDQIE